jgi:MFS family permease
MKPTISSARAWLMYIVAASFYFYDFILKLIPAIMMNNIMSRLQIGANHFGMVELSFYAIYTPMQLFCGPLLDEYGAKRILPSVIALCLIGTAISGYTSDFYTYVFARLLIGFGSAFAFVCVLKIASEWLPRKHYPFLAGLTTTFGMLGGIFSESIAPMFNQYHQVYFYSVIIGVGIILLLLALVTIEDKTSHDDTPLDAMLLLKDIYTVLRKRQIWTAGIIGMAMFAPIQLFIAWAIPFFEQDLGVTEVIAGNITSMLFWGACVVAPLFGWLAGEITHKKRLLLIGNTLSLIGMLAVLFSAQTGVVTAMLLMFLVGSGIAAQPLVFVYASRQVSLHLTATAVAATNFIVNLSSLAQPYIGAQLVEVAQHSYDLKSWRHALSIIPVLLAMNYIAIWRLREVRYDDDLH